MGSSTQPVDRQTAPDDDASDATAPAVTTEEERVAVEWLFPTELRRFLQRFSQGLPEGCEGGPSEAAMTYFAWCPHGIAFLLDERHRFSELIAEMDGEWSPCSPDTIEALHTEADRCVVSRDPERPESLSVVSALPDPS
jgi:hypothetical protein